MKFLKESGNVLFRGYYPGGGKSDKLEEDSKVRRGKTEPKELQEAIAKYPWLLGALHQHIVLVDYDKPEAFQCRLKIAKAKKEHCVVIESESRGGHFYWFDRNYTVQKSNAGNVTLLSLDHVDYKCGYRIIKATGEVKAADTYGTLSKNDKSLRKLVYCNVKTDNTLDEIPFYDLRLSEDSKKTYDFLGMGNGDGRQETLFNYMIPVKKNGFSYEQFKETAELIEQFLFSVPLGGEFDNAIRREKWDSINTAESQFLGNGNFQHNKFAAYLIDKYHIKKINGQLHVFNNGVYLPGESAIENIMLDEIDSLRKRQRMEVIDYMRIRCKNYDMGDFNKIAFNNGIYDVTTDSLEPFNPAYIITNKIPWDYNPEAKSDLVDEVLDKLSCNDTSIRYLLEEIAGACLYRSNTLGGGQAAILKGDKHNGKSTYISMIESMLGNDNYSSLDFAELGDRFRTANIFGKLANLGDDISDKYKDDVSLFKKIVTGETITAEEKGKPPFTFKPYPTLIFSSNNIPKMNDPTGAALRRLLIVPLNGKFTPETPDYDPAIQYKLKKKECVEYFIQLALDGLAEVLKRKSFTVPNAVQEEKDAYRIENNPLLSFIDDCKNDAGEIEGIINEPVAEVYRRYTVFCSENGHMAFSKNIFAKRVNQELGTESKQKKIQKKNVKVFELVTK